MKFPKSKGIAPLKGTWIIEGKSYGVGSCNMICLLAGLPGMLGVGLNFSVVKTSNFPNAAPDSPVFTELLWREVFK